MMMTIHCMGLGFLSVGLLTKHIHSFSSLLLVTSLRKVSLPLVSMQASWGLEIVTGSRPGATWVTWLNPSHVHWPPASSSSHPFPFPIFFFPISRSLWLGISVKILLEKFPVSFFTFEHTLCLPFCSAPIANSALTHETNTLNQVILCTWFLSPALAFQSMSPEPGLLFAWIYWVKSLEHQWTVSLLSHQPSQPTQMLAAGSWSAPGQLDMKPK